MKKEMIDLDQLRKTTTESIKFHEKKIAEHQQKLNELNLVLEALEVLDEKKLYE